MESAPTSEELLSWSKEQTKGYRGVSITDFSVSWKDGLALCALIHSLDKNQFQYEAVVYQSKEEVLRMTFEHASKIGIPQYLGASDLLVPEPDRMAVESYLLSVYLHWQQHRPKLQSNENIEKLDDHDHDHDHNLQENELNRIHEERRLAQVLRAVQDQHKDDHELEVDRQISFLSEKNVHVGKVLRESRQIKGLLMNVEEELTTISDTIYQNEKQNEFVKYQISEKATQLEDTIEKERQQYDHEIERLEKELEELRKKGPSDQQLALKRKLDEQCEKKDRLTKLKQQMEQEIRQLKEQLEKDEQQRAQLQARRAQAEQRRADLRLKHKEELQKLQRDLFESFNTEDKLQTDLLQQSYVKTSLQAEASKLSAEVKGLDGVHTSLVKQNTELKEKKQKLEAQLLGAKLYLEEETRILNFKELGQSDLQMQKKLKADERERSYDVKRTKEKEHRKVTSELVGTKEAYDKEYLQVKHIKRDLSKLEIKSDILKSENDEEVQRRPKKLQQVKETNRMKIEKEDSKHRVKVEAVASQTAALSTNTQEAQQAISIEKSKIEEIRGRADEISTEARSAVHSLTTEANSQREASRVHDNLKRELQLANDFLVGDKHTKTKTTRAKQKAEENLKSINETIALTDSKKSALDNAKDHLARDYELTKQDLKLAEKEAKKAKEDRQKLGEEKEKLKQDIFTEDDKLKPRRPEVHTRLRAEEKDANGTIEKLGQEADTIHDKTEALKREATKLSETRAALQFEQTQANNAKESERLVLGRDRKALQKLQEHRTALKKRLEDIQKSLLSAVADSAKGDLLIEEDFVKKRLDDVEKLIREEIKQL